MSLVISITDLEVVNTLIVGVSCVFRACQTRADLSLLVAEGASFLHLCDYHVHLARAVVLARCLNLSS